MATQEERKDQKHCMFTLTKVSTRNLFNIEKLMGLTEYQTKLFQTWLLGRGTKEVVII